MDMRKEKRNMKGLLLTAAVHIMIFVAGGLILHQISDREEISSAETKQAPEVVDQYGFITVQTTDQKHRLEIQGRVRAENRLELFPEVQGKMITGNKPFREGIRFEKDEVIFQLDDDEARHQLYASRSGLQTLAASLLPDVRLDFPDRLNAYETWCESLHPEKTLSEIPDFGQPRMERFLTSRGLYDKYYQIKSAENRLEKFTIRAPFSGILSSARAEPGQSVGPQFHAGTLVDPESYLVTATVRQSQLSSINIGDSVELTGQQGKSFWTATVSRINPSVDPRSQSVEIYLEVGGNGLREGMFLEGLLEAGEPSELAEIPKSALLRNGYVYAVADGVIRQVPVQVTDVGHESVWVSGLADGDQIIRNAGMAMTGQIIREKIP
jgi:membrane fusion protein, multidrug efflux system